MSLAQPNDNAYPIKRLLWPLFIGVILLLYVHLPYGHELFYPRHSWAQADRLALAMQFHDEGMDFFHPRTYNTSSDERVSGVEFPLQSYAAAALGKVFGRNAIPFIFRILTSLVMLLGSIFLFRIVDERIRNIGLSLLAPVFLLTSPTVQHYTWSYLPDAFGAGLFLIALYYAYKVASVLSVKSSLWCVGLACMAALVKMSVAFYLPLLCIWLFFRLNKKIDRFKLVGISALGASMLGGWFMYMRYLNETYHSVMFLAQPVPPGFKYASSMSWFQSFQTEWGEIFYYHGDELLTPAGYWLLSGLAILPLIGLVITKLRAPSSWYALFGVMLAGSVIGTAVMGAQLVVHDYYAIVLWMPTVMATIMLGVYSLFNFTQKQPLPNWLTPALSAILCLALIWPIQRIHLEQIANEVNPGLNWLRQAKNIPHDMFPKDSKVIFPSEEAPNLGQAYFDVKGMSRKLDLEKGDGLLKLLIEADVHGFSHAILPNWQSNHIHDDLNCPSTWINQVHKGNTYSVIHFKNPHTLIPKWIIKTSSDQIDTAYHSILNDTCLSLPWVKQIDGKFYEQFLLERKYGFSMILPHDIFRQKPHPKTLIFSYLNTTPEPSARFICINKKENFQEGLLEHRITGPANLQWCQDTVTIMIPATEQGRIRTSQYVECFIVNDHPSDTLWVRGERIY